MVAGEFLTDNNSLFLWCHAIVTTALICYRFYKRYNCNAEKNGTDGDKVSWKVGLISSEPDTTDTMTVITDATVRTQSYKMEFNEFTSTESLISSESSAVQKPAQSSFVIGRLSKSESIRMEDKLEIEHTLGGDIQVAHEGSYIESFRTPGSDTSSARPAVFAGGYNPENDEGWTPVVYPKTTEQRKKVVMAVKDILLFRSLDADQLSQVIDAMRLMKVKKGQDVIREGDDGDNFYVVESGVYEAGKSSADGQWASFKKYDNSGSFGELGLMYDQPRAATVKCLTGGTLWALDRRSFRALVLKTAFEKRKLYEEFISSVPILSGLTDYQQQQVVDALIPKTFPKGAAVVEQGDEADGMYFIMEGKAKVIQRNGQGEKEVGILGKREYFGELALLTNKPRAATVQSLTLLKTVFLDRGAFERLLGPVKDLMEKDTGRYGIPQPQNHYEI